MTVQPQNKYDTSFYDYQSAGSRRSAAVILPLVNDLVKPMSVLDVGCGVGTWLAEWVSQGVTDVVGLDGNYVETAALQIPADKFVTADLRKGFSAGRRFDLIQSLEVAEHLDAIYADRFVESLISHGDVILFSAAVPGQGGTHHVNEQWPGYWIEKFAKAGFGLYDVIRPAIWDDPRVEVWYRQNILVFSADRVFDPPATDARVNLVHPELWKARVDMEQHPWELINMLPGALRARFGRA